MYKKRYSSPAAGGGVHGMDVGTDPITMTEVGVITGENQVFPDIFMRVGEMISGIIGGEDNHGIISGYLTVILIAIGVTGKETDIGTMEDLDGAVVTVVGVVVNGDGVVETKAGAAVTKAGVAVIVDGVVETKAGVAVIADGAVVTRAGAAVIADDAVVTKAGVAVIADDVVVTRAGAAVTGDGVVETAAFAVATVGDAVVTKAFEAVTGDGVVEIAAFAAEIVDDAVDSRVFKVTAAVVADRRFKVFLKQAGEAAVVPISKKVENDKNDRLEDKAAKC
jgi:hypothetical protein